MNADAFSTSSRNFRAVSDRSSKYARASEKSSVAPSMKLTLREERSGTREDFFGRDRLHLPLAQVFEAVMRLFEPDPVPLFGRERLFLGVEAFEELLGDLGPCLRVELERGGDDLVGGHRTHFTAREEEHLLVF